MNRPGSAGGRPLGAFPGSQDRDRVRCSAQPRITHHPAGLRHATQALGRSQPPYGGLDHAACSILQSPISSPNCRGRRCAYLSASRLPDLSGVYCRKIKSRLVPVRRWRVQLFNSSASANPPRPPAGPQATAKAPPQIPRRGFHRSRETALPAQSPKWPAPRQSQPSRAPRSRRPRRPPSPAPQPRRLW